jgi:hypothetical protein
MIPIPFTAILACDLRWLVCGPGLGARRGGRESFPTRPQIRRTMIAVFKEDCLAPIATLPDMMRQPGDHHTPQSSHNDDDSTVRGE